MTSITISIAGPKGPEFKALLQKLARESGMSVSEWIVEACADKIRKEK